MPAWVPAAIILLTGLSGLAAAYWADHAATQFGSPPAAAPASSPSLELGQPTVTPVRDGSDTPDGTSSDEPEQGSSAAER